MVVAICAVCAIPAQAESDPVKVANREAGNAKAHPLLPAIDIVRGCLKALDGIKDYEATFIKREEVGGTLYPHHMYIKHRLEPFSVYLLFLEMHQGREVIYNDGKNNGNLQVHETGIKGLVGTLSLAPTSATALAEGRNPVSRIGLKKMVEGLITLWEEESKHGECEVKYYPNAKLGETACQVIECKHPQPREHFKYHVTRVYIDKSTGIAIRVEHLGFPKTASEKPPVVAEYTYKDIKTNVGLQDVDFDINNSKYKFK